jgi:hypothetical protein
MKKIFTLLFVLGMLAVAQAQPDQRDNRQFDQRSNPNQQNDQRGYQQNNQQNNQQNDQRNYQQNDQRGYNNGYGNGRGFDENNNSYGRDNRYDDRFAMVRRRDMEIARINQDYDFRIEKVKCNFFLSWWEKQKQIRCLQDERQQEISMVYEKYSDRRGGYDDRRGGYDDHRFFHRHFNW